MGKKRTATFKVTDMSTNKAISVTLGVTVPTFEAFFVERKGVGETYIYDINDEIELYILTEGKTGKEFTIDLTRQNAEFEYEGQHVKDGILKYTIKDDSEDIVKLKVIKERKLTKTIAGKEVTADDCKTRAGIITVTDDEGTKKSWKVDLRRNLFIMHRSPVDKYMMSKSKSSLGYNISYSVLIDGVETELPVKHAMLKRMNKCKPLRGDKEVDWSKIFWPDGEDHKLIFKRWIGDHDLLQIGLGGGNSYIHSGSNLGHIIGCYILAEEGEILKRTITIEKTDAQGYTTTEYIVEGEHHMKRSNAALKRMHELYNEANGGKNGTILTGDKFILRTGSTASESVQRNNTRNPAYIKPVAPKSIDKIE